MPTANTGINPSGAVNGTPGTVGTATIPPVGNTETQLAQLQANQQQQLNQQERQQKEAQIQSSMISQANALFSTWTPPAVQQFVAGESSKEGHAENKVAAGTTTAGATSSTSVSSASTYTTVPRGVVSPLTTATTTLADNCAYVKGGDIMMAVLTSTVNSDENSPVMATIVSGKTKGCEINWAIHLA